MIKLIKFFSIGLIVVTIILVVAFVYYKNDGSHSSVNSPESSQKEKGLMDMETAKNEMAKKNAQLMKSPLSILLEEGKWDEAVKMYGKLNDDKFRQFMMNRSTILFLNKESKLNKKLTAEKLTNFLWDEYLHKTTIQNVALINIAKIISENPAQLKDLQKRIEKRYYGIPVPNNEKAALLTALISYRDDISRAIFEDVKIKNDQILLSSAIRALKGWKEPDISNKLLKIARTNKDAMISAISFKILAVNGERAISSDIERLITEKNDMLVEAGLFIINQMNAKEFIPLVQSKMKDFSYFNRRFAEQLVSGTK